jgi:hypothetical protein
MLRDSPGSNSTLYGVNTTTGQATAIGTDIGYRVTAAHFAGGTLYGYTFNGSLISIDLTTGTGAQLASFDPSSRIVAFASVGDGIQADFDSDHDVDGDDLTKWQNGFDTSGTATRSQGDADGDLDVDGNDYLIWQQQFGKTANVAGVPEPAGIAQVFLMVIAIRYRRQGLRRDTLANNYDGFEDGVPTTAYRS